MTVFQVHEIIYVQPRNESLLTALMDDLNTSADRLRNHRTTLEAASGDGKEAIAEYFVWYLGCSQLSFEITTKSQKLIHQICCSYLPGGRSHHGGQAGYREAQECSDRLQKKHRVLDT